MALSILCFFWQKAFNYELSFEFCVYPHVSCASQATLLRVQTKFKNKLKKLWL